MDESQVIGSLYINPAEKGDYDTRITMWVRTSVVEDGLDTILFDFVKKWISKDWPFQKWPILDERLIGLNGNRCISY